MAGLALTLDQVDDAIQGSRLQSLVFDSEVFLVDQFSQLQGRRSRMSSDEARHCGGWARSACISLARACR